MKDYNRTMIPTGAKEMKGDTRDEKKGKLYGDYIVRPWGSEILAPDVEKEFKEMLGDKAVYFDEAEIIIKKWDCGKNENGEDIKQITIGIKFFVPEE